MGLAVPPPSLPAHPTIDSAPLHMMNSSTRETSMRVQEGCHKILLFQTFLELNTVSGSLLSDPWRMLKVASCGPTWRAAGGGGQAAVFLQLVSERGQQQVRRLQPHQPSSRQRRGRQRCQRPPHARPAAAHHQKAPAQQNQDLSILHKQAAGVPT